MWIANGLVPSEVNILNNFFILASYWLLLTLLISYQLASTFSLTNTNISKSANVSHTHPHQESVYAAERSLRVRDVAAESAVGYPHCDDA
jgi:hypothetical protein